MTTYLQMFLHVAPPDNAVIEQKLGSQFEINVNKVQPLDDGEIDKTSEHESVNL